MRYLTLLVQLEDGCLCFGMVGISLWYAGKTQSLPARVAVSMPDFLHTFLSRKKLQQQSIMCSSLKTIFIHCVYKYQIFGAYGLNVKIKHFKKR